MRAKPRSHEYTSVTHICAICSGTRDVVSLLTLILSSEYRSSTWTPLSFNMTIHNLTLHIWHWRQSQGMAEKSSCIHYTVWTLFPDMSHLLRVFKHMLHTSTQRMTHSKKLCAAGTSMSSLFKFYTKVIGHSRVLLILCFLSVYHN
jgi:hypothetical protein